MGKSINLLGQKFNLLEVIRYNGKNKYGANLWLCKCNCGNEKVVSSGDLRNKKVQSCGCLKKDKSYFKKYNEYDINDECVKVYLNEDKSNSFICDNSDWELLKQYKWCFNDRYVSTIINKKRILIHRLIMQPLENQEVDHIDNNPLNNKKNNLRICSSSENNMNRKKPKNNTSGHKGVYFDKKAQKWRVYIQINKRTKYIGSYEDIETAIKYREKYEKEIYKEFRR